jgi:S1-C subfamily serine protease
MSWVDLVIVVAVVLSGLRGHSTGALRQVASLLGLGVGFIIGTIIAPSLATDITQAVWCPLAALAIVLVTSMLGSRLGMLVGSVAARSLRGLKLGLVDSAAGIGVGVAGALVGCWMLAGVLGSTTWGSVASGIQDSRILGEMDKVMPPVPAIESRLQGLFRNADFPNVFSSVVAPTLSTTVDPKDLGPSVSGLGSPSSILKVLTSGSCPSEGTAFFVTPHEAVTNAHVVAGATRVTVDGVVASVALFDPERDIAVLRVPSLDEPVLRFLPGTPGAGTPVQVIGFPLDGSRTGSPGAVEGQLSGQGRDIYNRGLFSRTLLAVEVNVRPGNSGSPVMVGGVVGGVIESKSLGQASTAYAIPDAVVEHDIAAAPLTGTAAIGRCVN